MRIKHILLFILLISTANAYCARPSITDLQVRVIQLENEVSILQSKVTALEAQASSVVAKDVNGNILGEVIGSDLTKVFISTPQGYLVQIETHSGNVYSYDYKQSLTRHYESSDCSGQAYTNTRQGMPLGFVFTETFNDPQSALWYTQKEPPFTPVTIVTSLDSNGNCNPTGPFLWNAIKLYPNDTIVTGVSQNKYDAPVYISN